MNRTILTGAGIAAAVVALLLWLSFYTVHQSTQALVFQFGEPIRTVQEPGLHMKLPVVQQVERFERRVLDYDAEQLELILGDQKRLLVDSFTRYRITDPLQFRQRVTSEAEFRQRLVPIINSALRNVLGEVSLFTVLSEDRTALMGRIRDEANRALQQFGVELVDVRIKRADLPPENSEAIFQRMRTEREREAKELRAQGAEIAQRIRARADRERRVLIADARRDADVLRGEGDAGAVRIFGEAFGQDPAFFDFYRSMQAYQKALDGESTSILLSPDNEFFRFFQSVGSLPQIGSGGGASALTQGDDGGGDGDDQASSSSGTAPDAAAEPAGDSVATGAPAATPTPTSPEGGAPGAGG